MKKINQTGKNFDLMFPMVFIVLTYLTTKNVDLFIAGYLILNYVELRQANGAYDDESKSE